MCMVCVRAVNFRVVFHNFVFVFLVFILLSQNILEKRLHEAKLLSGDMIAQDAMYQRNCLTDLYKKANVAQLDGSCSDTERQIHGMALSEVLTHINKMTMQASEKQIVFALSKLNKLSLYFKELGMEGKAKHFQAGDVWRGDNIFHLIPYFSEDTTSKWCKNL